MVSNSDTEFIREPYPSSVFNFVNCTGPANGELQERSKRCSERTAHQEL